MKKTHLKGLVHEIELKYLRKKNTTIGLNRNLYLFFFTFKTPINKISPSTLHLNRVGNGKDDISLEENYKHLKTKRDSYFLLELLIFSPNIWILLFFVTQSLGRKFQHLWENLFATFLILILSFLSRKTSKSRPSMYCIFSLTFLSRNPQSAL
jgi:hypothetical protein